MSMLQDILDSVEANGSVDKQHLKKIACDYILALITKLHEHFPQVHLLSLLGYFDPRNVHEAEIMSILELGDILGTDGHQLWLEFITYRSFIDRLDSPTLYAAMQSMHNPRVKENMAAAYPLISDILARISVLPGSSAEVERVFSAMKRIKTPIRNRLSTSTLDNLIRITMVGSPLEEWDPIPSLKKWESMGNRKLIH